MTQFRVRLSDRRPHTTAEEQALDTASRAFHGAASLVTALGDGLRTSIGLVSAVMSLPFRIILIDEPEAFLHPTLARRVGRVLSETARDREASLVVATHSAEFLMGCIQAAPELRIVRLTYSDHQATARSIEPAKVVTLMNDPLLRSADALRALFHRGAIVTEADGDRAFYDEINYRLQQNERGVEDVLFMNAQNWQTIPRIVEPLRLLGIPAAAIFDFDVLMEEQFKKIWPLLYADEVDLRRLQKTRTTIKQLMDAKGRPACKAKGIDVFEGADKRRVKQFIRKMAEYGIYFVDVGELECWLAGLGVSNRRKPVWLAKMFTRLGSDPTARDYVAPAKRDVWAFIDQVENWIGNPKRIGIPN